MKPTERQVAFLQKFHVEPPPTRHACTTVISYILGEMGQSREPPSLRAGRYRAVQRKYTGKRVCAYGDPGSVEWIFVLDADRRVGTGWGGKPHGPFQFHIRLDVGKYIDCGISSVELESRAE